MVIFKKLLVVVSILALPVMGYAVDLENLKDDAVKMTKEKIMTPEIITAIKVQNEKHAGLSQDDIDALDQQWRSEAKTGAGELIDSVLANMVSQKLKELQASEEGKFSEIFVMDNKGLNVGQSAITSDYWQGDEDKFTETYAYGPDGVFMDTVELDESSGKYNVQVSVSVADPETGFAIGAITYGYIVE